MNFTYVVPNLETVVNAVQDIAIDHGKPKAPATPFKEAQSRMGLVDHVG
jgi:hypothetical protein